MLQWMSSSVTARAFDREAGDLAGSVVGGTAQISYLRYNVSLAPESVKALDPTPPDAERLASLNEMDAPENMETLHRLGKLCAERDVHASDFAAAFDLPRA
jgi:hypothetical protein